MSETENYYKNLYTSKDGILNNIDIREHIEQQSVNTLTENQTNKLEGLLNLSEMSLTLEKKNSENDQSTDWSFSELFFLSSRP